MGKLKEMLTKEDGKQGRLCINLRRTLSAIGSSWRTLPQDFGNWKSVYKYFCRKEL